MSDFEQWFNQYMLNKTESCLDRDILRWAKPILEVGFDLQTLHRYQSYTLPFKGAKKYLQLQQKNAKLKERLKEAESVIEFYGDSGSWLSEIGIEPHRYVQICDSDVSIIEKYNQITGGKKAREYFKKWGSDE